LSMKTASSSTVWAIARAPINAAFADFFKREKGQMK
jgi:hypothetical protein